MRLAQARDWVAAPFGLMAALLAALLAVAALTADFAVGAPRAVDIERAVAPSALAPSAAARASGAPSGWVLTRPLRAGRRFQVVGLTWARPTGRAHGNDHGPHIQARTRRRGGTWTGWIDVPVGAEHAPDRDRSAPAASDPVATGGADAVQFRLDSRPDDLRAHFVAVSGVRTPRTTRRVRAAGTGTGVLGAPAMVTREQWGADRCPPRDEPIYGRVQIGFVHHTVSTNDYRPEDSAAMVLGICRFHRNTRGWEDIGYNFLVDQYGTLFEGRAGGIDQAVVGAQALGYNSFSFGVSNLGTFETVGQTDAALDAMARLIRWKMGLHDVPIRGTVNVLGRSFERISGHRNANNTECPGDALYAQLPLLRDLSASGAVLGDALDDRVATRVEAALTDPTLRFPERAELTGRVASANGVPLPGVRVEVETPKDGRWVSLEGATTDASGAYRVTAYAPGKRTYRVVYDGDDAYKPDRSEQLTVSVGALYELAFDRGRVGRGEGIQVTGTAQPARRNLLLWVTRRSRGRWVPMRGPRISARGGAFRRTLRLPRPGRYRIALLYRGDDHIARSRSPFAYLRVSPSSSGGTSAPKTLAGPRVRGGVLSPPSD